MIDPNFSISMSELIALDKQKRQPLFTQKTFTRSNGTLFSRIYERLTKASRRRDSNYTDLEPIVEYAYRHGVKDTLEALRTELS